MNNKLKKQILKKICLKQELLKNEQRELDKYFESGGRSIGIISIKCRYCETNLNEDNFEITTTYWNPMFAPCCNDKNCKDKGENEEAYECQLIDENCNECKHFQRKNFETKCQQGTYNLFSPVGCYVGLCNKKKTIVGATRNMFQGMECFEHRRCK